MNRTMATTAFELEGFRTTKHVGIVRGITVRSRSIFGTVGASLQTLVGGNITIFTELCEKTREEAFELMMQHAAQLGANAVVGVRYDATEVMQGVTEVLCYGTAVRVKLDVAPGYPGLNRFAVTVRDYKTGGPVSGARLFLLFDLPARPEIGESVLELRGLGEGIYSAEGTRLSLAGKWTVTG